MEKYNDIKLLDCTLRDGGYINNWNFGFNAAQDIIKNLISANIDIVEIGYLRNIEKFSKDITLANKIEELNEFLPKTPSKVIFCAMAMNNNYDIDKLNPYKGEGIELIRAVAHDYDIKETMDFAKKIKEKGYKVSINPINLIGYSDEEILWIIKQVNQIMPWQFSIVDTYGSIKRRDLDRIVELVDKNLDKNIRLALHLHENMSMSFSLAQNFIDKHLSRPITVDGSLFGMGRVPGNIPLELLADYLNEYENCNYILENILKPIQKYIEPIKKQVQWGYTPEFFLSAKYNLHRDYAEYFYKKDDLSAEKIYQILKNIDIKKRTVFDIEYAKNLYQSSKTK